MNRATSLTNLRALLLSLLGLAASATLLALVTGCVTTVEQDARPVKLAAYEDALSFSEIHERFARERLHRTNNEIKRLTSLRDTTITNYLAGDAVNVPDTPYPSNFDSADEYLKELRIARTELRETIFDSNTLQLDLNKDIKKLKKDIKDIPYIYDLYIDKNELDVDVPPLPNIDMRKLLPPKKKTPIDELNVDVPK